MVKFFLKTPIVLLTFVLLIGFVLRHHNLYTWPREGATFDEFAWTFLGLSMWNTGEPTSWSPHTVYKIKKEYFNPQGAHFTLVTPYLEHPPLFGLIAGGFARLSGVNTFDQVNISKIRPLALILGILAIVSVYLLTQLMYGNTVGLLAAGIYGLIPSVAIGSRLVQNENFFIPFFLLSLYFGYRYVRHSVKKDLYIGIGIASLLPLAKVPWIAAPFALVCLFAYSKKWNAVVQVACVTLCSFSVFLLWGYMLDREVFINLWKLQLARYDMHFDSLFVLFHDPLIVDRRFVDGWIYFGWGAMLLTIAKDFKKHAPIVIGFLSYALVFVSAIPAEPLHGWYRYPFYPFLAISIALTIYEYWESNLFVIAIWELFVGLSMLVVGFEQFFGFSYMIYRSYIAAIVIGVLPQLFSSLSRYRIFRYTRIVSVIFVCLLTVFAIFSYTEQ